MHTEYVPHASNVALWLLSMQKYVSVWLCYIYEECRILFILVYKLHFGCRVLPHVPSLSFEMYTRRVVS